MTICNVGNFHFSIITICLPWPNPKLMPNRTHGQHWESLWKLRKAAHKEAWAIAKLSLSLEERLSHKKFQIHSEDVGVMLIFGYPDNKRRDMDGLLSACKPALDGIAQALEIDDYNFHPLRLHRKIDPLKKGFVIVNIGIS